jgi:anaerobic dimethyl sulfoxide reductase subunit B (iron-sulfur subunit)
LKTQYGFYFDTKRCIKCKSCEVACKQWKGTKAANVKLRRVEEITEGVFPDVKRHFLSISCRHCAKAPCIEACPTKAIVRHPNGIVIVNQDECIGCKVCLDACPFGIPQFDEDGLMQKCDMCIDRIENGQAPMCAATCPTQALRWGTLEELSEFATRKAVENLV